MNLNRSIKRNKWVTIERLMIEQVRDQLNIGQYDLETVSLVEAGIEEDSRQQPLFGNTDNMFQPVHCEGGVVEYVEWFSDGEDSRYETN